VPDPAHPTPTRPQLTQILSGRGLVGRIVVHTGSRWLIESLRGLRGLRGLILVSLLVPRDFGVWTLFRIAMTYGSFAALGVPRGLEREVSQLTATGSTSSASRADLSARTALTFAWLRVRQGRPSPGFFRLARSRLGTEGRSGGVRAGERDQPSGGAAAHPLAAGALKLADLRQPRISAGESGRIHRNTSAAR
jgi:hypothetical protein